MAKVKQSPKVKLAQKVVKRAVELTVKELKPKAIKKTVTKYPKGEYKKAYSKNYEKARKEIGLPKSKSKPAKSKKGGSKKKK